VNKFNPFTNSHRIIWSFLINWIQNINLHISTIFCKLASKKPKFNVCLYPDDFYQKLNLLCSLYNLFNEKTKTASYWYWVQLSNQTESIKWWHLTNFLAVQTGFLNRQFTTSYKLKQKLPYPHCQKLAKNISF